MLKLLAGLVLVYSVNSSATCMSQCETGESSVIVKTSCAAPGGPVHTNVQLYQDSCEANTLVKYTCGGMGGMEYPQTTIYNCKKCADEHTCEEIIPGIGL